jgi:hypothetical protein
MEEVQEKLDESATEVQSINEGGEKEKEEGRAADVGGRDPMEARLNHLEERLVAQGTEIKQTLEELRVLVSKK